MNLKPSEQISTTHHNILNKNGIAPTRKRTHLTQRQIASLQSAFALNQLPDASVRHGLSLSLGITERTVQIWFQNRRAKARKLDDIANGKINATSSDKKSASLTPSTLKHKHANATTTRYQPTFRSLMTPQLFEEMNAAALPSVSSSSAGTNPSLSSSRPIQRRPRSASKPEKPKSTSIPLVPRFMSEEVDHQRQQNLCVEDYSLKSFLSSTSQLPFRSLNHDQSNIVTLPAHLLRIGTWTRFANITTTEWGLLCYCSNDHLIWQIQADNQQFRIHIPFNAIHQLSLGLAEDTGIAQLNVQLDPQPLIYTMCLNQYPYQQEEWVRCGDFSEGNQASLLCVHEIQGQLDMLQQAVLTMLTAIPELDPKLVLLASPSLDDMSRDLTISPSATPEPSSFMMMNAAAAVMNSGNIMYSNHHAPATLDKSLMLQAPMYHPSPSYDGKHIYNQMMML